MEKRPLPPCLEGPSVTLRKLEIDLAPQIFGYIDQDRARLGEFLPWVDGMRTVQDELGYIRMTHEKWDSGELYDYGIFRQSDGFYIGNVGVHTISWQHERCELGYWILSRYEGQGLMAAAVRVLEKACFDHGFHRVEIHCSSQNVRSASVPRRNGYRMEGHLREDAIINGSRRDTWIFAKLRTDGTP